MLQSCTISFGIRSGYKKLSKTDREKIVFLDTNKDICDIKDCEKIYSITGKQLLNCIDTNENVMVYFWKPYCTSEFCYLLTHVKKYCDSQDLVLYAVISEYYNLKRTFSEIEYISQPLFSINEHYYQTQNQQKFIKLFMSELLQDEKLSNEIFWHTSFVFKNGKLIDSRIKMEDDNAGELKIFEFKPEN